MKKILVVGVDSIITDAYQLAKQVYPDCTVEFFLVPSSDYYHFDLSGLDCYLPEIWSVFIAVNEFYINDVRRALYEQVMAFGYETISLLSPDAYIGSDVKIGRNIMISSGCFIGSGSVLEDCCFLRANVVLSESVNIGKYATLEANVSIRELCVVGDFSTICANSSLVRGTIIGAHCYLNLSRQYSGVIPACTFYSPVFENPVRVLP